MSEYYVLMVNETGTDDSVIHNLKSIETVKDAYGVFGPYDAIVKLESADESRVEKDISQVIRKLPQIRSTLTLGIHKEGGFRKTTPVENEILEKHMAQAFVMIHCNRSNESQVIESLKRIPEVVETNVLIGSYEIISKVVAPTYNEISDVIANKMRKVEGIKTTTTLNIIENQGFHK